MKIPRGVRRRLRGLARVLEHPGLVTHSATLELDGERFGMYRRLRLNERGHVVGSAWEIWRMRYESDSI